MRRNGITLAIGLSGLLIWGLLVASAGHSLRDEPVEYDLEDMDVPDPSELELPETETIVAPQIEGRSVRPIAPEVFASPAVANAENLERVAPREPFSERRVAAKPDVVLLPRPISLQRPPCSRRCRALHCRGMPSISARSRCQAPSGRRR